MSNSSLSSCAFLSDAGAFNLSDLLQTGPRDLSMVIDLLEFAQAAMLAERVYVTPETLQHSDFLRDLDFVTTIEVAVTEGGDDGHSSSDAPPILIDLDDRERLIASEPVGDLALAMAHSEHLRGAPVFNVLCHLPGGEREQEEQRLRALRHVMMLTQYSRDILPFEDEESSAVFAEKLGPALQAFRQRRYCRLSTSACRRITLPSPERNGSSIYSTTPWLFSAVSTSGFSVSSPTSWP